MVALTGVVVRVAVVEAFGRDGQTAVRGDACLQGGGGVCDVLRQGLLHAGGRRGGAEYFYGAVSRLFLIVVGIGTDIIGLVGREVLDVEREGLGQRLRC